MSSDERRASTRPPGGTRRQSVALSPEQLVVSASPAAKPLPLVLSPATSRLDVDLVRWMADHRVFVNAELLRVGGILFRGFAIGSADDFRRVMEACSGSLLEYTDAATPRHAVSKQVYSSTDYPADQIIELHNECAYARTWPMKVFFHCAQPAASGGATPIADCRGVLRRLSAETVARFQAEGVMYVRNFGDGPGPAWQSVFGTSDLAELEAVCRRGDIEVEHRGDGRVRTRQRRAAIAPHARTGEPVWFNQVAAYHISSVEPVTRRMLLAEFGEDGVPKNSFYGDGTPIDSSTLEEIRRACDDETVACDWQQGDVLVLDNMLVAHGRASYTGPRRILVGMAESC